MVAIREHALCTTPTERRNVEAELCNWRARHSEVVQALFVILTGCDSSLPLLSSILTSLSTFCMLGMLAQTTRRVYGTYYGPGAFHSRGSIAHRHPARRPLRRTLASTSTSRSHENPLGLPRNNQRIPPTMPRRGGPPQPRRIPHVKHVVCVSSGKGGWANPQSRRTSRWPSR